jgi:hypothetical protein
MQKTTARTLCGVPLVTFLLIGLSACGGGDPENADPASALEVSDDVAGRSSRLAATAYISDSQRIAAATATAQSGTNDCSVVRPFYWEMGTRDARKAGGSVGAGLTARTKVPYASASKWLYGAYVAQRRQGLLSSTDLEMLTFRSGYTALKSCEPDQSVDACLASGTNGEYSALTDGRFYYNGGHMQKHASMFGLGVMTNSELALAMSAQLGADITVGYSQPQLAGGGVGSSEVYARFLRKLLGGQLRLGSMLGSSSVCTNASTCGLDTALYAPVPPQESWRYSLGHWVESDPVVGDGAFSSPGAFGFYPWINAERTHYGILARVASNGARGSALCGRQIRKAWNTGEAQLARSASPSKVAPVLVSKSRRKSPTP